MSPSPVGSSSIGEYQGVVDRPVRDQIQHVGESECFGVWVEVSCQWPIVRWILNLNQLGLVRMKMRSLCRNDVEI